MVRIGRREIERPVAAGDLAGQARARRADGLAIARDHELDLVVGAEAGARQVEFGDQRGVLGVAHEDVDRVARELAPSVGHVVGEHREVSDPDGAGERHHDVAAPVAAVERLSRTLREGASAVAAGVPDEAGGRRDRVRDVPGDHVERRAGGLGGRYAHRGGGRRERDGDERRRCEEGRDREDEGGQTALKSTHAQETYQKPPRVRHPACQKLGRRIWTRYGPTRPRAEEALMQVGEGGLKAVEARARHEAKQRQQTASTSHLVLVLLRRGGDVSNALSQAGLRESGLLSALKAVDMEQTATIERTLERAAQIARELGHRDPDDGHVLAAILSDTRSHARRSMSQLGVDLDGLGARLRQNLGIEAVAPAPVAVRETVRPPLPPPRSALRTAVMRVPRPMVRRPEAVAPEAKRIEPPVSVQMVETDKAAARNVRVARKQDADGAAARELGPHDLDPAKFPLLIQLGRNLTALAASGAIDPVIGRATEVERLLDVLARRRSNNPVLVGPPGVGKTAIVEALALRLVSRDGGTAGLDNRILVEISAGALASGTGVRGAMAERLRKLRAEVAKSEGRVVLFLDEIHAIVGSGGDGPDDIANELKAAFARGELPCIGATTDAEYRKHFERDAALARRFSPVIVDEPTPEATLEILHGAIDAYARHHRVGYARDAIAAAVELTVRFVPERRLPDKAIAVLDHAGARVGRRGGTQVEKRDVAEVVAEGAQLSVDRLLLRDADRLLTLEATFAERVVGHRLEMSRIAEALRKGSAGFRGKRPLATFLFLGPTGVGKTETAKTISDAFFAGSPMTRLDMSEYSEPHTVARLFGAPPGYLGHDEGGQLTEAVRKRPYQLVLLDEIEKAHSDVLLALLPLLDEGRVTDGRGRTVDFTNTVIVMTSNLGVVAPEVRTNRIGFGERAPTAVVAVADKAIEAARRALPPELWNRIDEPLWFGALDRAEVAEIARRMLRAVASTLAREHGAELRVEESAIEALVEAGGFDATLGARPMRRTIGRLVESKLATLILEGSVAAGTVVIARGEGGELTLRAGPLQPELRQGASVHAAE
jgi:ATP-dependent Clp protease ATP-binding subunit ClpC